MYPAGGKKTGILAKGRGDRLRRNYREFETELKEGESVSWGLWGEGA